MKLNKYCLTLFAFAAIAMTGCKHDDVGKQHFDNKLYVSSAAVTDNLLIDKNNTNDTSRDITTRLSKPAAQDVTITFEARPTLAAQYNMMYGDNAQSLPAKCYSIPEKVSKIKAGDVSGNPITVNFTLAYELDNNQRYVLPVTIVDATNIEVLESSRTVYFLFKGAALINVVADITKMYFPIKWASGVNVSGMKTITIEALLRSSNWEAGRGNALSTVFGVEASFLIRIGDSDRPRNQVQLVSPAGNWPGPNEAPGLPVNEWVHIAIVYDATTGERAYYQNGVVVKADNGAKGSFSLGSNCYIGYAYDASRWLPGEMSELRIWNVARSAQDIADNPYYVDPQTPGLIAYWKFNEGAGNVIQDATGNGTTLTGTPSEAGASVSWNPVELPKIGK